MESAPVEKFDARMIGLERLRRLAKGSDVVVITAGVPRKPGMSRDDLVATNEGIVADVVRKVLAGSPNAILIVVSNPLDAMCEVARRVSKLPRERVFGMAGVLDSARMRWFIADALGVSVENTHAFVLGGHGDTMVPLPRFSTVAGIPIPELLPKEKIDAIVQRTRDGGAEIVNLLEDVGLVRAGVGGRRDGGRGPAGQEEDPAVRRLPPGRVRHAATSTSAFRCGSAPAAWRRSIEIALTPDESAALSRVGRRRPRALPHPQGLNRWRGAGRSRPERSRAGSTPSRASCRSGRSSSSTSSVNASALRAAPMPTTRWPGGSRSCRSRSRSRSCSSPLPIVYHGLYGLYLVADAAGRGTGRARGRRRLALFQRATGVLLFAFILFHLLDDASRPGPRPRSRSTSSTGCRPLSASPWIRAAYVARPARGHVAPLGRPLDVRRGLGSRADSTARVVAAACRRGVFVALSAFGLRSLARVPALSATSPDGL